MATTKKVQLPEGFDPYDMRLKRQFSDQADKMNVIALSRKNYNLCCGAMHNGQPCKNPAGMGTPHKGYGRCKIHGGLATGPKTAEGRARQIAASTKHGLFSKVLLPDLRKKRLPHEQFPFLGQPTSSLSNAIHAVHHLYVRNTASSHKECYR